MYFADQEVWEEINKDIKRTRPDMSFFFMPRDNEITPEQVQNVKKGGNLFENFGASTEDTSDFTQKILENEKVEKNSDVMARILFIYAKLNPGVKYVQGMNEILAPIYYIFANDPHPSFSQYVEHDSFFCFTNLMAEIRDIFVQSLDQSELGIKGQLNVLNQLLKQHDFEVWQTLED